MIQIKELAYISKISAVSANHIKLFFDNSDKVKEV